jgi:hypothetical protein
VSSLPPRALFAELVDDAAVFPPGLAPAPVALAEHHIHRASAYADLIGPLLVPVARLDTFLPAFDADPRPLRVNLVGDATRSDAVAGVLDALAPLPHHVRASAVEVAVPQEGRDPVAATARRLDAELPDGVLAWLELPRGGPLVEGLQALAEGPARVRAKFRTGGTHGHAFPSADELAQALHVAVRLGVPLKLTAGLHRAVRHTAQDTGFRHHGFVNVLAAVADALDGVSADAVARRLEEPDAAALTARLVGISELEAVAVRRAFASFGCCGVTDPVGELVDLGLLPREVRP